MKKKTELNEAAEQNVKAKKKKNSLFGEVLNSVTKWFLVLVAVVVVCIGFSGFRVVKSGNVALILRFGELVGNSYEEQVHEPGLLMAFPYIIDEVVIVPTGSIIEQTVTTHYTAGDMTTLHNNGYVITGDQNIAVISASVKYTISDPVAYALNVKDIGSLVDAFVSSAMVDTAACMAVDDILTSGKDSFARNVMASAQEKLTKAETGVMIGTVELTNVSMPAEVKEVYDLVNAATVQSATMIEQANQYSTSTRLEAEAKANTLKTNAESEKAAKIAAANTDLSGFYGLLDEYTANPDVVRTRLYTERLAAAIGKIGTVRVVQDGETKIVISGD